MAVALHDHSEWIPDQSIDGEGSRRVDFDPHWVVQQERGAETIHVVDRCASLGSTMRTSEIGVCGVLMCVRVRVRVRLCKYPYRIGEIPMA